MRTPHTHFTKGRTVWIKTKDGRRLTGRFVERRARCVVLDNQTVRTRDLAAMSDRRSNP
jgi:hypothetical protein